MSSPNPGKNSPLRRREVAGLYLLCFAAVAAVWISVRWTAPPTLAAQWKGIVTTQTGELQQLAKPTLINSIRSREQIEGSSFDEKPAEGSSASTNSDTLVSGPDADGFLPVSFQLLSSFKYDENSTAPPLLRIPASVSCLNRQKIAIKGFMVPLELTKEGKVHTFLLVKNQLLCCFGVSPGLTDFIFIRAGETFSTDYVMDQPITVKGTLHIGEVRKDKELLGLYILDDIEVE